jgi:alkylation response protein AidB-like acyl-CoA dehydrogenase
VDTSLNEVQRQIQAAARDFFRDNCPTTVVRELERDERGYAPELWRQLADLGWLGLTYPERYGGGDGSLLDLYPIYVEMGRSLFPSPHLSSSVIAGETILNAGTEAQQRRYLSALAQGETIIAPALMEPEGEYGPDGIQLRAAREGDRYRLDGTKLLVPYAHVADTLLVAARTRDGADPAAGITLFLVETSAPGVTIEPLDNIAGYRLFAVTFDAVAVEPGAVVGAVDGGWPALALALDRAAVLRCAEIAGAGERVLEIATEYARTRVQFGTPIGKNQAVQYLCSDIAIATNLTDLLAKQAAWRLDERLPAAREVALAKGYGSEAAQTIVHRGQEVHAGVAFMLEHDMQLYTRRAKHWEFDLGDTRYHQEAWAVALGL